MIGPTYLFHVQTRLQATNPKYPFEPMRRILGITILGLKLRRIESPITPDTDQRHPRQKNEAWLLWIHKNLANLEEFKRTKVEIFQGALFLMNRWWLGVGARWE